MAVAKSKITGQGQISVPAEVRRRLGVGPGSTLEWDLVDGNLVVRRAGTYSSVDIHVAIFARSPRPRTVEEFDAGIARYMRKKHALR